MPRLILTTLLLVLCGCANLNPLRPPQEEWPQVGEEFARMLRWNEFGAASSFLLPEARNAFQSSFPVDSTLQIVNLRHEPGVPAADRTVQSTLYLEYYRPPSVAVRKAELPLEWRCIEAGALQPCLWRISGGASLPR